MTLKVSEEAVKAAATFSFLCLLSDKQALKITGKIIDRLKKEDGDEEAADFWARFVEVTFRIWEKNIGGKADIKQNHKAWKVPQGVSLSEWTLFRKNAYSEEFLAVLWGKVIGIEEAVIARGLGVSAGTISYRLNRGIRFLSQNFEGSDRG